MSLLKLIYYPDDRLRKVAKPVTEVNDTIQRIIDDMFETLYFEKGIGLAATQVDIHLQIIIIHIAECYDKKLVIINPELIDKSDEITSINEGCLSIPEQRNRIPRSKKVKIHALDRHASHFELEANDLLAVCIQHEMDHLVGKLFVDYLSPLKRQRIRRKIEKMGRIINRSCNNQY